MTARPPLRPAHPGGLLSQRPARANPRLGVSRASRFLVLRKKKGAAQPANQGESERAGRGSSGEPAEGSGGVNQRARRAEDRRRPLGSGATRTRTGLRESLPAPHRQYRTVGRSSSSGPPGCLKVASLKWWIEGGRAERSNPGSGAGGRSGGSRAAWTGDTGAQVGVSNPEPTRALQSVVFCCV